VCGACTVHIDGVASRSCITPVDSVGNSVITTIEAIGGTAAGAKIQKAWLDREVVQCGYCQSGQIMSATALLAGNPRPNDSDIDSRMVKILVQGFCLFNGEFDRPRSVSGWLAGRVRPKVSGSKLVSSVLSSSSTTHQPWQRCGTAAASQASPETCPPAHAAS
jgi:[2Fe-2S] binding domain